MDRRTIIRNLKELIFLFERLVFKADLYKERYGAKYLGWPVVKYTRTRILKIIPCLIVSE